MLDTWKSGELSSRIDYIFLSENICDSIISHDVKSIEPEITDHKALIVKMKLEEGIKSNRRKFINEIKNSQRTIRIKDEDWESIAE